jgi:hypothetical protein
LFYVFQVFSLYSGGGESYDGGGSGNAVGFSADFNSVVVVEGDEEVTRWWVLVCRLVIVWVSYEMVVVLLPTAVVVGSVMVAAF